MAGDATEEAGRWRQSQSETPVGNTRAKKWSTAAILSAILLAVAAVAVYLISAIFFQTGPKAYLSPIWVARFQRAQFAPIPWIDADRKAIQDGAYFSEIADGGLEDRNLGQLKSQLDALRDRKRSESVVIYVATYGLVDRSGKVRICAADSDPSDPETMLALGELLAKVKACPADRKLLVLDILKANPSPVDPGGLATTAGVADLAREELDAAGVDGLRIIVSASPGQEAIGSSLLGRSNFNKLFCQALDETVADGDGDGWIRASELASFLQSSVDRWAQHNRGVHQQVYSLGSGRDFAIVALNRAKPKPPAKVEPAAAKSEIATKLETGDLLKKKAETPQVPEAATSSQYPAWLQAGWEKRAAWWADRSIIVAPRALRMYDAILLRAERDWQAGVDPAEVKTQFDRGLAPVESQRSQARDIPRPPIRSIGQGRAFGLKPPANHADSLAELLNTRRKQPTPEALKAAVKAYIDTLKGKTDLDIANAINDAAADSSWNPEFVKFLDGLVDDAKAADPKLQRNLVELRFLQSLAKRAAKVKDPKDWSDLAAKTAWQVVTLAEELNSRVESLPWIGKELDKADALRLDAQVMLLPETAGIVSWKRTEEAWNLARDAYQSLLAKEQSLDAARVGLTTARLVLPAYVAYLNSSDRADLEGAWLEAANATQALDRLMSAPPSPSAADSEAGGQDQIIKATADLNRLIGELLDPFQSTAMDALIRQAGDASADPKVVSAITSALSVPFPAAADRVKLCDAIHFLEERLAKQPSEELVETSDGLPDSSRIAAVQDASNRKRVILGGLLRLAGIEKDLPAAALDPKASTKDAVAPSELAQIWGGLAAAEIETREELDNLAKRRDLDNDRAVAFAPVFGSDLSTRPSMSKREAETRAAWTRLASRYLYERTDMNDPDQFYEAAALECVRVGGAPVTGDLKVELGPDALSTRLSVAHPEATLSAKVTWTAAGADSKASRPFQLSLIPPDDPRLQVSLGDTTKVGLNPETPVELPIKVRWNEQPDSGPAKYRTPPIGFLLKVTGEDDRSEYLLLPVYITAESARLRLVLSDSAAEVNPLPFDLKLRTLPGRQKFFLHVKNPTETPKNLLVRVISATSPDPASEVVLNEAKVTAAPSRTTPVTTFTAPAIKPTDPLGALPPGLKVRLIDADSNAVLDEAALQPSIALALNTIRVMKAQFVPSKPGEPNRLNVSLRAQPELIGAPCPVALDVSRDANLFLSLLAPPKGRLVGEIEPAGEVTIYAEALALDPSAPADGLFAVDVDNQKRALWFKSKFPIVGGPQLAQIDTRPRVRFNASPNVKADQPARLDVDFLVDNAPDNATLEFRLGRFEGGDIIDDITPWTKPPKQSRIGFDARGEAGALIFEASLTDWSPSLLTAGIRGERRLQARLIDADGRTVLDSVQKSMVLDDLKPQEVALGPIPSQVPKGTASLPVSAVSVVPASSVKEMTFFLGKSADYDKALAAGAIAKGKPSTGDPSTWTADLMIPPTAVNPLFISVRVVSGVDLVAFATEESEFVAAAPTPAEEKAKKEADANKPGTITGKVTQGTLPQPNLVVTLVEVEVKPGVEPKTAETKSDKAGLYTFKEVKPGKYQVSCKNLASLTKSIKPVTVDPGKTGTVDLDLLR